MNKELEWSVPKTVNRQHHFMNFHEFNGGIEKAIVSLQRVRDEMRGLGYKNITIDVMFEDYGGSFRFYGDRMETEKEIAGRKKEEEKDKQRRIGERQHRIKKFESEAVELGYLVEKIEDKL